MTLDTRISSTPGRAAGSRLCERVAGIAFQAMHLGFTLYILLFPLGRSFREGSALLATTGLVVYYLAAYRDSNLKRLGLKWIYFAFLAYLAFKTVHSVDPAASWYALRTNLHRGFALVLVGLEVVRGPRDLRHLVLCFLVMTFYEGLDGVYQLFTGHDLVRGTEAIKGRLTGSMKTYRIGNLMALALPPALGLWWLMPRKWRVWARLGLGALLLAPGLWLAVGSQTRTSYAGLFAAFAAFVILTRGMDVKKVAAVLAAVFGFLFLGPSRTSWEMVMRDGRVQELWPLAIRFWKEKPILGHGLDTFTSLVNRINYAPTFHPVDWSFPHPHSSYLQLLCETGVVGLALFLAFVGSFLAWSLSRIRKGIRDSADCGHWKLTALFWASSLGYLFTSIGAHNFFRTWWLGMAMAVIGITMGAALKPDDSR